MFKNTTNCFFIKTTEKSGRFTLEFSMEEHEDWESLLDNLSTQYNSKIQEKGSSIYPYGVSKDGLMIGGAGIDSMQQRFPDVTDFFNWIKVNKPTVGSIFIFDRKPLQPQNEPVNNSQGYATN